MSKKEPKTKYGHSSFSLDEDFLLEEILEEYGTSRAQKIMDDVDREVARTLPEDARVSAKPAGGQVEPPAQKTAAAEALPQSPRPISLETVVGDTVSAVLAERPAPPRTPRRGLFSRRPMEETEPLYAGVSSKTAAKSRVEPIGPERDLYEMAEESRRLYYSRKRMVVPAFLLALLVVIPFAAEQYGLVIPMWTGDLRFQSIVLLVCLGVQSMLCRHVFFVGVSRLRRTYCVSELLAGLSALAAMADCAVCLSAVGRTAVPVYGAVACLPLAFAQWGITRESRGWYDTYRTAAMDDSPPYLVTDTERGACKQRGSIAGFYTASAKDSAAVLWQRALLPLVLVGAFVFAGLTSLGAGKGADFALHLSAILTAGATCVLSLCWPLSFSRLARRLQKTGCAVAGWFGAERISRRKSMILMDADLFPPGTIQLNGIKIYGEDRKKVVVYSATMARRAGSGLERLFDGLLRGENAKYEAVDQFSFYEEGGWSATIHGETVLMGTASFMRKMDVILPGDINLKTGIFLAFDHRLAAVFAVKYNSADNVNFALRMMRESRIEAILAVRDPNITPALLKRKFHKGVRAEYPDLSGRVALSEAGQDGGFPLALLFREGLLPYAETVAGSRRMCQAVRWSTIVSMIGSLTGMLLTYYLLSQGAYGLLTPLALETFLLLWALPVLLISAWR